jgi:uncharacterized protein (DUF488 family)
MHAAKTNSDAPARPVLTIGHSTHAIDEFIAMLQAHEVRCVVDVRTIPRSRRHPQFEQNALRAALAGAGIGYAHLPGLGGLRHPRRDSPNAGWRNESFRGFADYMQTAEYEAALQQLVVLAARQRLAVMCAEALPWRCHRSLIADSLTARGIRVEHITGRTRRQLHAMTAFARVEQGRITYPGNNGDESG